MSDTIETPRRSIWPLLTIIVFAIVLILPLCTFQVRNRQVAIITTFGKRGESLIQPGLHWKLPWPIQRVHTFDQRLRLLSTRYAQNYTADQNTLVLTFLAAWRIESPNQFLVSVGNAADAERALSDLISTEKNVVIGSHPVSHLVSTDPAEFRFSQIEDEIHQRVAPQALEKYGIALDYLGIEQLGLPEAITADVFRRMQTERENRAAEIRQGGQVEADRIRYEAEAERDRLLAGARAQAKLTRSQADTRAAEAYEIFQQNSDFHLFLQKLEALEQTVGEDDTIILDRDVAPYDLLQPLPGGAAQPRE